MNDQQIRLSFHAKLLRRHKQNSNTVVVDELGLHHGRCRADIAVLDGQFIGYEIKSDVDSLRRLDNQITSYNGVFDRINIIVTAKHQQAVEKLIPEWWGIISVWEGKRGAIHFEVVRRSDKNPMVSEYSIAQLLWRNEAQEILDDLGFRGKQLRERRDRLYDFVIAKLGPRQLRKTVREYLIKRINWRYLPPIIPYDDLYLPNARS